MAKTVSNTRQAAPSSDPMLFFSQPILNSPYEEPTRHWELDENRQPTQKILLFRPPADFITPIPKPKNGHIAVKVINPLGDEVMKVFRIGIDIPQG